MANDTDDVDELRDRIGELSAEDRDRLLRDVRRDRVVRYLDLRREYLDDLRDSGAAGLYGPDSPLAEHCAEHPEDPLCWVVSPAGTDEESLTDHLDARRTFVERLREEGLADVERSLVGPGGAGMPGPEGWPPRPPGWPPGLPWPPYGPVAGGEYVPGERFGGDPIPFPAVRGRPVPFPAVREILYGRR